VRRLALLLVAVLALAACGSSSKKAPLETTSKQVQAFERAQITQTWESFFSSKTPVSKKPALLQNGSQFKSVIEAFASNPLAKNVSAKVSKVTLEAPADSSTRAKVAYTIYLGSTPALSNQTGVAVRENPSASWKVGDASLCKLIALEGSTPPACKS
jgi:ABC-type glycerol-3-phosphate transport system substrate-binding protein